MPSTELCRVKSANVLCRTRAERAQRQRLHAVGKTHYEQIRELRQQGRTIVEISRHLGWSYSRVARFYRADEYSAIRRGKGKSCLDQFAKLSTAIRRKVSSVPDSICCAGQ